ncbi:hypothetical protein HSR122_0809 [Halapricum desulfuricans]|uniref:Uncharacterized protein n=1 Tax=Halapricum desulfuricans TaxID=2841257 RepID=A0A897NAU3_9EURY|nr:hypothetical protein HSR122_0809 [Halapricum desulfuricans]
MWFVPITVVGLLLVLTGLFVTRFEYRMKVRHNDNHGITDML